MLALSIGSERIAMMRPTFVCGLMAVAAVVAASAEDFPLTFRTIAGQGRSGLPRRLRRDRRSCGWSKPAKLKKEPKAVSRHPLYGECRETTTGPAWLFRLDESKGEGKGYDQLIVDMNQNGDLTDDGR